MLVAKMLVALVAADYMPPPADHVLNPDFDTDPVSPSGYVGSTSPDPSPWRWYLSYGGQVTWDPLRGDPGAGSAHVGNVRSGARYDALAQCVTVAPGAYSLVVRVASQLKAGAACQVRVQVVDQTQCNTVALVLAEQTVRNVANSGSFETLTLSGTAPPGAGAMAIWLGHVSDASAQPGASDCWFDHVRLGGDVMFRAGFEQ